jgi:hypothetical protein
LHYRPNRKRSLGRTLKWWSETVTGTLPNTWCIWIWWLWWWWHDTDSSITSPISKFVSQSLHWYFNLF